MRRKQQMIYQVASSSVSGTQSCWAKGRKERLAVCGSAPQCREGEARAETIMVLVSREQLSEEEQFPKGGERQEAGSLREKYCPIRDGSGERNLWERTL